ncbi:MAG: 23S rRNA (uracil(1939)-C(5))-methyltransferase RlmD [Candidatus Aminicenantes bacterium]|nr:23S rRNA (uracil(1939)-C(5))-methyltransferase RlmD [Candidatus Aminicenantes bacterium]
MRVVLASQSPRRKELLARLFPAFEVDPSAVDETAIQEEDPVFFAMAAAEAKARDVAARHPEALVVGADTIVCLEKDVFGKPADRAEAERMLGRLSGRKHRVITGVALYRRDDDRSVVDYEITYVIFKPLSEAAIAAYLDGHAYLDKAGSYAIQEIGPAFVERVDGDYDNVVGLPVGRLKRMLREWDSPDLTIDVSGIDFASGWAFGSVDGGAVLVPGALPGDRVQARIVRRKPRSAKVIRTEAGSPDRVAPPCSYFGSCGGCAFQNLAYARQLELKQARFLDVIRHGSGLDLGEAVFEPILPSPSLFDYRNKMEFAFGGEAGAIKIGLRGRSMPGPQSHKKTVGLDRCLIFGGAAEAIFPATREFANASGLPPYDPLGQKGYFRNLVLREGKATGEYMAVLVTKSGGGADIHGWADRLRAEAPRVTSVWSADNDSVADLVDLESARLESGAAFIEEELGGLRFRIYPDSFFQPNPRGARLFYDRIAARVRETGAKRALGLFCGSGSIELSLAGAVDEVVGIDSAARNIRNAEENAALNGISNARFVAGLVEKTLDGASFGGFDLLILDPPRAGIHPEGLRRALALRASQIVYMSCNPATLARDLAAFTAGGYVVEKLHCADFFPHTPHMEALAFLSK